MANRRNLFQFEGRLTHDIKLQTAASGSFYCYFTLAQNYKDKSGNAKVDFVEFVAWGADAEYLGKYFKKGQFLGVDGIIKPRVVEVEIFDEKKKTTLTELRVTQIYPYLSSKQKDDESVNEVPLRNEAPLDDASDDFSPVFD